MTGAAGMIGTAVAPLLAGLWDLRLTDLDAGAGDVLDVSKADDCRAMFADADAVIHLAAVSDPAAAWEELQRANVVGAYTVAQAAIDCGVRRLVLASSLQVVKGYPDTFQRRASDPVLPISLYGATKAWAEALGAWVAATSTTSVVALRLGWFADQQPSVEHRAAERAAWLSPRDCAHLLRRAVEAEGITFLIANGVSANRLPIADLSGAIQNLGYQPTDDAWSTHTAIDHARGQPTRAASRAARERSFWRSVRSRLRTLLATVSSARQRR
jgi:nucleoside-diphosphate-sugar epimerase